jgi:hypothetical protein
MDQNFNSRPAAFASPPTPTPPNKPSTGASKAPIIIVSVLVCIALGLAVASLAIVSGKADKAAETKIKAVDKRVAAIEEADKYTEKQVDNNRYQAVFLSSGQVYFGKITEITKDTMKLEDIFYLKTGSVDKTGNPIPGTDVSLTKLGAELHSPDDTMFIERKNLSFWENLKADGQVSKAIAAYKKS